MGPHGVANPSFPRVLHEGFQAVGPGPSLQLAKKCRDVICGQEA